MKVTRLTQKIEYWAADNKIIYSLASQYYNDIIHREAKLANINSNDHVLCIGGGPCPFSAILLHQATGARVTVIDNDKQCVRAAQQLVTRMALDNVIQIFCQDGKDIVLKGYSVILLALQVSSLDTVLANLEKQARPGTKLLVRRPKQCLNKMYCNLSSNWLTDCIAVRHKRARNIANTLLYIKQESLNEDKMAVMGTSHPHDVISRIAV